MLARLPYALTIALSSFLIFLIEPLAGKSLLPHFGGAASVWSACLVFFTGALFAGYAYAALLVRTLPRMQFLAHGAVVAFAFVWMVLGSTESAWGGEWGVLGSLVGAYGPQFLLLSATAPLVQQWYARRFGEPYRLYALSNAASFLGLLAFPFVLEPWLPLSVVLGLSRILFCVFALLVLYLAWVQARARADDIRGAEVDRRHIATWIALAALPTALLSSTTTQLTQVIAPVPLLWIVPLALYLLSFVLAFGGFRITPWLATGVLASSIVAYAITPARAELAPLQLAAYLALLFGTAWICHGHLYASRPAPQGLTSFYLATSLGGLIGTLSIAFAAPLVFSDYLEFPILVGCAALVALWSVRANLPRAIIAACALVILGGTTTFLAGRPLVDVRAQDRTLLRDFYGVKTVGRTEAGNFLLHGRTLHGLQLAGASSTEPQVYYSPLSGVGRALSALRAREGQLRVAVIGLGTGTLAAYCAPQDTFAFFEIDPQVATLARDDFSYLSQCPAETVAIGDGRMLLGGVPAGETFDLIAVDAFDSDAIPLHLLTREAFSLYASRLARADSIIALHVSNRYLDLPPVVIRTAADAGLASMVVRDYGRAGTLDAPTTWVLLARDSRVFTDPAFAGADTTPIVPARRGWTDDFSSILSSIRF